MMDEQQNDLSRGPISSRPLMPAEYGLQGEQEGSGLIPWERVEEQLAAARSYWIGTTRPDGRPHAMPVWGLWLNGAFFFSTSRNSRKARNIAENPAMVVHLESGDNVVILEGRAELETDRAVLQDFVDDYEDKYQFRPEPDDPNNGYYRLHLQTAFAWLEADFPGGATRWEF
jgi:general stress protein 26